MHLLILGATGRTGTWAYTYALEQGFQVTILVRNAHGIEPHDRLTIVKGSCTSDEDMRRAFTAVKGIPIDSVLIYLNAPRVGNKPWGKFLGPPRLIADSTRAAARALREQQKQQPQAQKPRLVVMSALGVGESYAVTPYVIRFIMNWSNVYYSYVDHNAVNDEIEGNCGDEISWTLPMAVGLGGGRRKAVRTFGATESGASLYVTRESCARWMVDVAAGREGDMFSNKRVIVSN